MDIPILFEDEAVLAINKPAGIVVNRAESVKSPTIQDWVEKRSPPETKVLPPHGPEFISRSGVVHRLDKDTTGVLVIAKTDICFSVLQKQFQERSIKKTYLALVHGKLPQTAGEVRAPVGRLPWRRERFGIIPGGREAVTTYQVLSEGQLAGQSDSVSLVEVHPQTGRTHQIRVHFKYLGHPLVGDELYAGRKVARGDRRYVSRVMLHAHKISFTHPVSGKTINVEAPLADDMMEIIKSLQSGN